MKEWIVRTTEKHSVEEREIWVHPQKGKIVRMTGYRWATYIVATDDKNPPNFKLRELPDGDGTVDSIEMNNCGYDADLLSLDDGQYTECKWPKKMSEAEREKMESVWEDDQNEGWEKLGWTLDDNQVWIWGSLDIKPAKKKSR